LWVIESQTRRLRSQQRLAEHREAINAKIQHGIEQFDRGEGSPEDQLDAHLVRCKRLV
jgi:hypothetical protein